VLPIIYGSPGNDNINGGNQNQTIYGGAGNDIITGSNQIDEIYGGSGNDTITGSTQADKLFGGSGNDTISGDQQSDLIVGGWGADMLAGGTSSDTFQFLSIMDSPSGAGQGDVITDFTAGASGDILDFSRINSATGLYDPLPDDGSPAFGLFASSTVHAHSINYFQSGADTVIWADTDGNTATVELQVTLQNVITANLVATNFIL
jgi:Ca2+-binding RTX toxin-like protein